MELHTEDPASVKEQAAKPPKKRRSPLMVLAIIFAIGSCLMIGFFMLCVLAAVGGAATNMAPVGSMETDILDSGTTDDTIAVINIDGAIAGSGTHLQGNGLVFKVSSQLRAAAQDASVKAVILQIDSPGGGLTASDIIYNEVLELKKRKKKVVVSVGSMAASGGYYIAAPADYIIASPTSLVGSIGVIMAHFDVSQLLKQCGVKVNNIKSADRKDILSPFRQMTEEERQDAVGLTKHFHDRFVQIITAGRNLPEAEVRKLANGMIYSADDSLKAGLIDSIGYFADAVDQAKALAGISGRPRIVAYKHPQGLLQVLMGPQAKLDLQSILQPPSISIEARWPGFSTTKQ